MKKKETINAGWYNSSYVMPHCNPSRLQPDVSAYSPKRIPRWKNASPADLIRVWSSYARRKQVSKKSCR